MNTINTFLLSFFTSSNERYGQDISSLHKRYQNLSLIYVNVGLTSLILLFNGINGVVFGSTGDLLLLSICLPLSIASFFFMKTKRITASILAVMLEMHIGNFIGSYLMNFPLVTIFGGVMHLCFVFALTSSLPIHLLNLLFCFLESLVSFNLLLDIYNVTLTTEQRTQILILGPTSLGCSFGVAGMLAIQKLMEKEVWKIAKENYARRENLTKEVVEAMEAKDNFVSMLSHEIRNPLNALKGSIEYLSQVVKNSEHLQVLKNAKMSGDILLNLVNNILDAAKFKSDKMEIVYSDTDVAETVTKVFTINSERFKEKGITAKAFLDFNIPELLWADQSRLLQILMNLVSNAVKFTPKRGKICVYLSWCHESTQDQLLAPFQNIPLSEATQTHQNMRNIEEESQSDSFAILDEFSTRENTRRRTNLLTFLRHFQQSKNDLSTISRGNWEPMGDCWSLVRTNFSPNQQDEGSRSMCAPNCRGFLKIQVTDTGCGIEENDIPKLFGMFQQTTSGMRSHSGGTGLGLWICKQLCLKMNGDITVYSKAGQGSSFVLFIPIENNVMSSTTLLPRSTGRRRKISALVVDDYSVNRYLHKLLLEQEGVDVVIASDGKEAFETYKSHRDIPFDFIFMDVQMPVMDGFTSAKLIRKWERENNVKKTDIYFVSGEYFNETEVLERFRSQGDLDEGIKSLKKPLDGDILKKIVSQYKRQSIRLS